jgi:hypothetical protein
MLKKFEDHLVPVVWQDESLLNNDLSCHPLPRNSVVETLKEKSLKTMKMKDDEKRKFKQNTNRRVKVYT